MAVCVNPEVARGKRLLGTFVECPGLAQLEEPLVAPGARQTVREGGGWR
jgi:hypothetical protein